MSLGSYDRPDGSYTQAIPPGTAAFRKVISEHFGFSRTEVVRDRSRCAQKRSEHCECRGIDCFTTEYSKGRPFFDWCVKVSEPLGIEAVIFQDREIGFGDPNERRRSLRDHWDHVHVGLNRWAAKHLTESLVKEHIVGTEALMVTPEDEQKIRDIVRDELKNAEVLRINVVKDGKEEKRGIDHFIKALAIKAGVVSPDGDTWIGA